MKDLAEFRSHIAAAVLFVAGLASTSAALLMDARTPGVFVPSGIVRIAIFSCLPILLGATVLVFIRPHLGYLLALLSSAIALTWFVWGEFNLNRWLPGWNSWILLNSSDPSLESPYYLLAVELRILALLILPLAAFCSLLRLVPGRVRFRRTPVRDRTWPVFATGVPMLAVWFVMAASPYRVPVICNRGITPEFQILYVEKHGLHFREITVIGERDGQMWIMRNDRHLFQFKFERQVGQLVLSDVLPSFVGRVDALRSLGLLTLNAPPPTALRSWNGEGWYVQLRGQPVRSFTSASKAKVPREVRDLYQAITEAPERSSSTSVVRDVCLGFCYDPLAALGLR